MTSNKGIATRSKNATRGAPGLTTRNKKLLAASIGNTHAVKICEARDLCEPGAASSRPWGASLTPKALVLTLGASAFMSALRPTELTGSCPEEQPELTGPGGSHGGSMPWEHFPYLS